ncbi:MAG: serine/threonine-protein kinase [Chromatiales bacterium]
MASFRDALRALARGTLKSEVLLDHIGRNLARNPQLLTPIIAELSEAYASGLIEADTFATLKAHARRAVEASQPSPSATGGSSRDGAAPQPERPAVSDSDEMRSTDGARGGMKADTPIAPIDTRELDLDLTAASLRIGADTGERSGDDSESRPAPQPLTLGSVIKERFILDEVIGVGGMGTVYKGRDVLKVEARDRNPHVALKVLNEDFKKHPDAFIALQREASRQQRLAHPNIATVYDFDRAGETVFVTMEYMEGQPLNQFLRKLVRPQGGLRFAEAYPIIRGLGEALSYAHEHGIVHSDFKPANCFLTKSGIVKVIDFGIARVIKRREDMEKTLFDPRKFGALTPAYASPEMLNNGDPDPRDDIYALACVAYELLAGRHPFDKKSANQARDRKMVPGPIKGLTRQQMRALTHALAFARDARTGSVRDFLDELGGKHRLPNILLIAGALLAAIVLAIVLVLAIHRTLASEGEADAAPPQSSPP